MKEIDVRQSNRWVMIGMFILLFLMLGTETWACPTCKDGMTTGANHQGMVKGYFFSILFMMSMPFVILTAMCSYFYFLVRRARAEMAAANGVPAHAGEVSAAKAAWNHAVPPLQESTLQAAPSGTG
jgi:uncharacterized membrane protein